MRNRHSALGLLILGLLVALLCVQGIEFTLFAYPPNTLAGKRCLGLHIQPNTLVTGYVNKTINVMNDIPYKTNLWIVDSLNNIHLQKNGIVDEVRFSFRTHEKAMDYYTCVVNELVDGANYKNPPSCDFEVVIQPDMDLFDESLAHDLKLKPLESDIRNLETSMSHIVKELDDLFAYEKILRDTNESINDRVKYLGIVSLLVLIGVSVWQMLYLRRYFKSKKLI